MKEKTYKDQIFIHKKTGRRVIVLNEPAGDWDYMTLLYFDRKPMRLGKKQACYFDYDYEAEVEKEGQVDGHVSESSYAPTETGVDDED